MGPVLDLEEPLSNPYKTLPAAEAWIQATAERDA